MAAGSHRKYSRSGPRSGGGSRSRSAEACPSTCYSSDVTPGSRKVTHLWEPFRLGEGDQDWWPSPVPLRSSSWLVLALGAVASIWPHPSGGLAESFDAFLQHDGSCQHLPVGFPWPWQVLTPLKYPTFLSVKPSHKGEGDNARRLWFSTSSWLFHLLLP